MLSKRIIAIARGRGLAGAKALRTWETTCTSARRAQFHSTRLLQDETVKVPTMAESISEGTLRSWSKKVGDSVEADEEVATIETDKIDVSVNAPKAGKITELLVEEDTTVTVGQDLFKFEPGASGEASSSESDSKDQDKSEGKEDKSEGKAEKPTEDPKSQEMEQDKKDPSEPKEQQVSKDPKEPPKAKESQEQPRPAESKEQTKKGGDPDKKVSADSKKDSGSGKKDSAPAPPRPAAGSRGETRVKMNRMRLRIAERLKESQNAAASLTTFNEIDMSSLISMRAKYKDEVLKTHEVKLGYMSAFARACCLALKEIPSANASIEGDEIVYRDYVDLSVAVATPKGLVTPVVRNAEGMNFVDIEKEIASLGKKARDGKLTLEDMSGGTFTISNGGVFGSLYGTPIINLPQAAVLGMHAIKDKPVVVNGEIVIRPIMVVALTYDHRLLDGREAVTFLVKVRDYLEDPRKMLLA